MVRTAAFNRLRHARSTQCKLNDDGLRVSTFRWENTFRPPPDSLIGSCRSFRKSGRWVRVRSLR